jgi:hypothetical protein
MGKHETQKVNYIQHLLSVSEKFSTDDRLSASHISLYYALFQTWNAAKFLNPISICREELMRSSKLGSVNTYTKCLKELDKWKYIKYMPSFNPLKGSKIYLFTFNKTTDYGIDNTTDKGSDKGTAQGASKGRDEASVKVMIPSLNSLNNINSLNRVNGFALTDSDNENINSKKTTNGKPGKQQKDARASATGQTENEGPETFRAARGGKSAGKSGSVRPDSTLFRRPDTGMVAAYFVQNEWPEREGQKFFNHYESNGWLIGGKSPMQNWQAAAGNWMLNAENFSHGKFKNTGPTGGANPQPGRLNTAENKNYGEPL